MRSVSIQTGRPYQVQIGQGLLSTCGGAIAQVKEPCRVLVVSDSNVAPLYGESCLSSLKEKGFSPSLYTLPAGEASKSTENFLAICEHLAAEGYSRTDLLVALGGGVVGDITGFCAASYLRGIDFASIPTTFLAQIDSSVGGKTGVNLAAGKNLLGAFWQPLLVLCDTDTLRSLDTVTFGDGICEALKYGATFSAPLFETIAKDVHQNLEEVIFQCVSLKAQVVSRDERDTGERMLLNFGHTLAHAIEKRSGLAITHGHAVGMGMVLISQIAARHGICTEELPAKIAGALARYDIPTQCPYPMGELLSFCHKDKKKLGSSITLVLLRALGEGFLYPVALSQFDTFMTAL